MTFAGRKSYAILSLDLTGPLSEGEHFSIGWEEPSGPGDDWELTYYFDTSTITGPDKALLLHDVSDVATGALTMPTLPEAEETITIGESGVEDVYTWVSGVAMDPYDVEIGGALESAQLNLVSMINGGEVGHNLLHLAVQPTAGETVTISGVYTWVTGATGAYEVEIGDNVSGSRDNWMDAINGNDEYNSPNGDVTADSLEDDGVYMSSIEGKGNPNASTTMTGAGNEWENAAFVVTPASYWTSVEPFGSDIMIATAKWGGDRGNDCLTSTTMTGASNAWGAAALSGGADIAAPTADIMSAFATAIKDGTMGFQGIVLGENGVLATYTAVGTAKNGLAILTSIADAAWDDEETHGGLAADTKETVNFSHVVTAADEARGVLAFVLPWNASFIAGTAICNVSIWDTDGEGGSIQLAFDGSIQFKHTSIGFAHVYWIYIDNSGEATWDEGDVVNVFVQRA
jgi:hypothetical protein